MENDNYDIYDEESQQRERLSEKQKQVARDTDRRNDLITITKSVSGRRFLWRLLAETGIYNTPFVQGSADGTAFECGRKNVGLKLLEEIMSVDCEVYATMMKENEEYERHLDARKPTGE